MQISLINQQQAVIIHIHIKYDIIKSRIQFMINFKKLLRFYTRGTLRSRIGFLQWLKSQTLLCLAETLELSKGIIILDA